MTTYFTSDWHIGHQNIIKYSGRPFASVTEMNSAIVDNYCEVVTDEDTVYFLGDMAMGRIIESLPWLADLPGHKILIPGNHDRIWIGNRNKDIVRFFPEYMKYFDQVFDGPVPLDTAAGPIILSHFPPDGDSQDEDRYKDHRPPKSEDSWHVHGHVHEVWKIRDEDQYINVGVDVWDFMPVSLETIEGIISSSNNKGV